MPTPDESILFELVDLLNERTIARYQEHVQNDYDVECDPFLPLDSSKSFQTTKNDQITGQQNP